MERYFSKKRKGDSSSLSNSPNVRETVENRVRGEVELNLNDIVSDPGLRKPIEEFDIAIRDQVRRVF